jgi:tetratricopeptide (TPR) repeat protein
LNEGLAQYYQSFRLRGHKAEFGHDYEGASYWLETHEWAEFYLLFAMKGASEAYRKDNELRTTTYAEGWAIAHYLQSEPGRAARFDSVLSAMHRGVTPMLAFRGQFPPDEWPTMIQDMKKYIHDGMLSPRTLLLSGPADEPELQGRAVPTAEALMRLGDLMMMLGEGRGASAKGLYQAALKQSGDLAQAHAAIGYLADRSGDSAKAEAAYSKAEAIAPRDARVALLAGLGTMSRAARLFEDPNTTPDAKRTCLLVARAHLEGYIHSGGTNPEALGTYGLTFVLLGEAPDQALRALEVAADELPSYTHFQAALRTARALNAGETTAASAKP